MAVLRLHITVGDHDPDLVVDALWVAGTLGVEEQIVDGRHVVIGAFDDAEVAHQLAARWHGQLESVDDDAGLDAWRLFADTTTVGRWTLIPEWLVPPEPHHGPPQPDQYTIVLDPGRSFGSGSHVSTQLMLATLADIAPVPSRVIDIGCGSGVLSIAAARLGATEVIAIDIDDAAVDATVHNGALNGVDDAVGAPRRTLDGVAPAKLVLANMLLADIETIASQVVASVAAGGKLLCTGHLVSQRDALARLLAPLTPTQVGQRDEWSVMTFTC